METQTKSQSRIKTLELVYMAVFAALMAICSWISIPTVVPFTLQTFAVFLTLILLGGRKGTFTVLVYLLIGAIGVPVFAGFSGGIGILLGSTGGYLVGFLAQTLIYWVVTEKISGSKVAQIIALVVGLFVTYALGTVWFVLVYTQNTAPVSFAVALSWCVTPYVLIDLGKLALAFLIGNRLRKHVKI